jgi:NAD(P)-dependent dehydrogenase (short-subunit alcohol dehydrogenase family)
MHKPVVVMTGALTGIGRATAVAFAKEGARLVVSGRREAEGKALEAELHGLGAEAVFINADVRHDDEVRVSSQFFGVTRLTLTRISLKYLRYILLIYNFTAIY